jgi:membrane peptidoglycan carboxypeptidase
MSLVPYLVQKKRSFRQKHRQHPSITIGLILSTTIATGMAALLVAAAFIFASYTRSLPSLESIPVLLNPSNGLLLQPTRLYDRTGENILLVLANPAASERTYLYINEEKEPHFSPELITVTVSTIDPTFWENPGYTTATLVDDTHPTLAQKLVDDLLLKDESRGFIKNLRVNLLAAQITSRFGHEQVLEWYLNQEMYGKWIYGANQAAQVYFGKSAADLDLAEAAVLAAIAEVPGLSPLDAPQVVLERQSQILENLFVHGLISQDEYKNALNQELSYMPSTTAQELVPAFTNLVLEQLGNLFPLEWIDRGGLRVITTLDFNLQTQTDCATQSHLKHIIGDAGNGEDAPCEAAQLLPTLPYHLSGQGDDYAASVVILDPTTGQILSMVGSSLPGLDPAHLPGSPPGTLITPFIYLTAFSRGYSPGTLIWDIPSVTQPQVNSPTSGIYYGPLRIRTALANDYPGPATQLLSEFGSIEIARTTSQLGVSTLESLFTDLPSLSNDQWLNQGQVTLLEMTQAFAVFANQGILTGKELLVENTSNETAQLKPFSLLRVEDNSGKTWLDWNTSQSRPVLSQSLAYLMNHILSDESARWPSLGHPNPLEIGRPAGAKLGVTLNGTSAWTMGYTPQVVIGVWMGQMNPTGQQLPPTAPAALWHAIIQYALRDLPSRGWEVPPGIRLVDVCDPSGLLATIYCPVVIPEVFIEGSEPVQYDNLYRQIPINRETGKLATVFTPPELVKEEVYLVVPPEAADWARQAGLPVPPDTYDVIYVPAEASPDAQINQPEIFSHVSGKVRFVGTAAGAGFEYYRLQIGEGLNPQEWLQIGEDVKQAVKNTTLGEWDTTGLSGLYAVQLLVIYQDQRVERFTTQITVDNTPPDVEISSPLDGQTITGKNAAVIFQAKASDNLVLNKVEFWVDYKLLTTLNQPPLTVPWTASLGKHTLRVVASDLAGNQQEAEITFTVK